MHSTNANSNHNTNMNTYNNNNNASSSAGGVHNVRQVNNVATPQHYDMKPSISSYSLNQPQYSAAGSSSTRPLTNHHQHVQSSNKMYNNSESFNAFSQQKGYQSSSHSIQSSIPSHSYTTLSPKTSTNSTIPYPNTNSVNNTCLSNNSSPNNMSAQNNSYQHTYYYSSSTPSSHHQHHHHHYSAQHAAAGTTNTPQRPSPIDKYASNSQSVTCTTSSVHSMRTQHEKLPNMKDIFGSPWPSTPSKQEILPCLLDESIKRSEQTSSLSNNNYNNNQNENSSSTTLHPSEYNHTITIMEELQQKLKQQEVIIKRLEMENDRLRNELDSYNVRTSNSTPTVASGSGNNVKKRKISSDIGMAGNLEMKSQSSHSSFSSQTDQYSNSNEDTSDVVLDEEDEDECEDGADGKIKKRKLPPNFSSRSKKRKDDSNKKKPSRSSGRRDATVGDLEKYTVKWKGESYVLVNAFKNRTQILNYYVPLYQNNFPERTCKLVLCNDEYKVLSSENPNTVEKKKHAWRVSVFTMDFYNFVKNFDKRTLRVINSSSGFIPNVNFEAPTSPNDHSPSTFSRTISSNSTIMGSTTVLNIRENRLPPSLHHTLQPTSLLTPSGVAPDETLNMAPKPISTIHNK